MSPGRNIEESLIRLKLCSIFNGKDVILCIIQGCGYENKPFNPNSLKIIDVGLFNSHINQKVLIYIQTPYLWACSANVQQGLVDTNSNFIFNSILTSNPSPKNKSFIWTPLSGGKNGGGVWLTIRAASGKP